MSQTDIQEIVNNFEYRDIKEALKIKETTALQDAVTEIAELTKESQQLLQQAQDLAGEFNVSFSFDQVGHSMEYVDGDWETSTDHC